MAAHNKGYDDVYDAPLQYPLYAGQGPQHGANNVNPMMNPHQDSTRIAYGQPYSATNMYEPPSAGFIQHGGQEATWVAPTPFIGCPPGLEYLTQIDQLLVKQRKELLEILTNYEANNKYEVKNVLGQTIYVAKEATDFCARNFCGPNRAFTIHIFDNMNQEVIEIKREYKCHFFGHCFSCAECCQDIIVVEAPPGNIVGFVKQEYEGCNIRYNVMNENKDVVLRIHGPSYLSCYCPGDDYPFSVMSANGGIEVGKISKQWSNLVQEYFTDADNFGIQFPMDLDVKIKAVILGAVFLIDFMFFEVKQKDRSF